MGGEGLLSAEIIYRLKGLKISAEIIYRLTGLKIVDQPSPSPQTILDNVLKGCFLNEPISDPISSQINSHYVFCN